MKKKLSLFHIVIHPISKLNKNSYGFKSNIMGFELDPSSKNINITYTHEHNKPYIQKICKNVRDDTTA